MERKIPPPMSLALDILRTRQGWTQKELAAATGIQANLLSDYERGRKTLTRERFDLLLSAMGLQPSRAFKAAMRFLQDEEVREPDPPRPEARQIEEVAAESGRMMADLTRSVLTLVSSRAQVLEERQRARTLWERLRWREPAQRRVMVEKVADFRNWALSELLCEESIKAAGDSADRALELAGLALRVAELAPGEEAWRQRIQGYAWAHVGNARRVKGDLPSADEALGRARRLWEAGSGSGAGLLEETRVLGLEVSLRIEQRRLDEALALLDRSLALSPGEEARNRLLIKKARTLESLDQNTEAISALRQITWSGNDHSPRLGWMQRFIWMTCLCNLGLYQEAEAMFPQVRPLTLSLGNDLDTLRIRWLEGRILSGLGRRERAIEILSAVSADLASLGIAYDTALAKLELAVLYLDEGRNAQVKELARQIVTIFRTQGVSAEATATLKLFWEAAEREAVTLDLVQPLVKYLRHAHFQPGARSEGAFLDQG